LEALHGNIWHQGTTYEATACAVPFLARLAEADASLAPELLFDLGAIADGQPYRYGEGAADPRSKEERLAYAFPEERALLRDALTEAFNADDVTPLDQAAIVMAMLRGGDDESYGDVVLLDVLVAALQPADEATA
jgi:hypothetical protein